MSEKNVLSSELLNQIKQIKIFTKRLMKSSLSGDYLSAFKGSGLEFDQIRDYQLGDDVRFIDWNASAKKNKIMIKQHIEERDRTVILVVDVSASQNYSSKKELKKEMISKVAAVLTFISSENKDKVGAIFFSDKIEKWIPPARGRVHVSRILKNIFCLKPTSKKTNIQQALNFLVGLKKRNSVVFFLSDWIDDIDAYSKILKVASCEYDFVGIRFLDEKEKEFPNVGFIDMQDFETGQSFTIDTKKQKEINLFFSKIYIEQKELFQKYKIDLLDLSVGKNFINPMINFFRQRIRRQI
ncbi:DUF58 domain-containing protein [Candidatus Dependentiae bacterium]|nr:DUF58 domain-containing protein [Candidatus Dependentiae bacterium]